MASLAPAHGSRAYRWLLALPFVWQVGLVPAVNGISLSPLNIPFPMAWQMLGVVLTSIVVGVVFRMDRKFGVDDEEAEFLAQTEHVAQSGGER